MVEAIISGGQSGADSGGLFAGSSLGLNTGGIAPNGWKTEDGPAPWLADFGLTESESPDYVDRTRDNVMTADATVIFGKRSPGSNKTEEYCRQLKKSCLWIPMTKLGSKDYFENQLTFKWWIDENKVKVLNVSGNRESVSPGICLWVQEFLELALI